jgi:signal transduction histidine kinase
MGDLMKDNQRAANIIRTLRNMFGSGNKTLSTFEMNELVSDVVLICKARLHRNVIDLVIDLSPQPLYFTGDKSQLQQVLLNLITNANDAFLPSQAHAKRIEVRRLSAADGQSRVRFRFAHAGTDSWYFGLDNLGLYSIPATPVVAPAIAATLEAGGLRLTWPAASGFVLEQRAEATSGAWSPVAGVSGNSALVPVTANRQWFRLNRP